MTDCGVDPLKWELKWVNGVCYRLHPEVDPASKRRTPQEFITEETGYFEDDEPDCLKISDEGDSEEDGKVRETYHVPDRYLGRICGQQHSRRKELETDTGTSIRIPEKGSGEDIVVAGDTQDRVAECIARIKALVEQARSYDAFTHFLSIPLTFDVVKNNLNEFQCLALTTSPALTEKLFVRERKLHLTICCLSLHDRIEVQQATEILLECEDLIAKCLENKPIDIRIRGLEIMNDDPGVVDVLYAKIQEKGRADAGRLQDLCDAIVNRFRDSGLMVNSRASDRTHLKLHMTVMNSKFAEDPQAVVNPTFDAQRSHRRTRENTKAFSAKKILQVLGQQDFGGVQLKQVELNVVSQVEPGTGYYRGVAKIHLPTDP